MGLHAGAYARLLAGVVAVSGIVAACVALLAVSAFVWARRMKKARWQGLAEQIATMTVRSGGGRACASRYAWLLGREVEARVYEGRGWERYVVVAVGWHGSICVRRAEAPDRRGWWVKRWAWEGNLRVDGEVI